MEMVSAETELRSAKVGRVQALRGEALRAYESLGGFPTTRQEEWRYTNLSEVARTEYTVGKRPAAPGNLATLLSARCLKDALVSGRVVLVNGVFIKELSFATSAHGLTVAALSEGKGQQLIDSLYEKDNLWQSEALVALNASLVQDVVCISLARGVKVERPLEILSVTVGESSVPTSAFPRILIKVEEGAELSVVERQIGVGGDTFVTTVTECDVAQNATLHHVQLQELGETCKQVGVLRSEIARDAKLFSHVFHLGGALVRNEIRPVFTGTNGECFLNGLTAISNSQHIDNYTVIDHAKPHCYSREHYKGVYGGKASGAFCGTIIVRQEAQRTNAVQSNQSLLLTPTATIDSKPQLKIWADDVKCTHGATVGQLDEDALFYLRSRGIPQETARRLLIKSFVVELIESLPGDDLREHVRELFLKRLETLC
jgi:Fe-S cluster assembly protein SufD